MGQADFRDWIARVVKPRALGRMIQDRVFESAMQTARFLPEVIDRQLNQSEFVLPIWEYLEIAASEERVRNGRTALRKRRELFIDIERRFGVEPEIIVAIWGLETGYGVVRGSVPVLSALATHAWRGNRQSFFEDELVAALRILQSGHTTPDKMVGSWAGAMGHGQFMPSSFLNFAVDFDGDGRKDIWSADPTDALASIANYLSKHGWRRGQPWGYELTLPDTFDYELVGLDQAHSTAFWQERGVRTSSGDLLPDYGVGSILLPAGASGAAFMLLRNAHSLLRYNNAEAYVLGVGALADRIGGHKGLVQSWPVSDRVLNRSEVREAQEILTLLGFSTQGVDGLRGPNTVRAVRGFQAAQGWKPDGYLSGHVLDALRARKSQD
ncbi:MAG: lytic murein transglycosylase [Pseudomonadota bacterium]|nr:lytic murein transglycosylase [Pseudomonadota bacterium]